MYVPLKSSTIDPEILIGRTVVCRRDGHGATGEYTPDHEPIYAPWSIEIHGTVIGYVTNHTYSPPEYFRYVSLKLAGVDEEVNYDECYLVQEREWPT